MTYYKTVQEAIDYIEIHLKDKISLYDIAEHVSFSVPHFYRIFKAVMGETVKSYIMKRRLGCAAVDLKETNKKITDIAYEYCFESHDVFTRAFLRTYHMSPSKYRNAEVEAVFDKININIKITALERSNNMKYIAIQKPQLIVIGMECKAKTWDADGAIGKLWSVFLENVDKVNKPIEPNIMYGICEYESCNESDTFTYMAGIGVEENCDIPDGMVKRIIKQQRYIQGEVPENIKTPDAYKRTIEYAKENGYLLDENDEIEVYEEVFQDPDDHAFKLWIPVK